MAIHAGFMTSWQARERSQWATFAANKNGLDKALEPRRLQMIISR